MAKTYAKGVDDLVKGKADFYRLGPASYIEAKKLNSDIHILALESNKGKKYFNGIICVRGDSTIYSIAQLENKRFAFGNQRSTIGRYLSQLYLLEQGVTASRLSDYSYLGRHDKVGSAVAAGLYDAGALKESTYKKLLKRGHDLRILASFTNVTKPWVARSGLNMKIQNVLRQALLEFKDTKALAALKKDGFLPGQDADYARIRIAIEKNLSFFDQAKP